MGLFDFFRKKQETRTANVKLVDLGDFLANKRKENELKARQLSETIKILLSQFINQLSEKNNVLKNIDINERKADPRAKFIIRENLFHYIENVEKLIKNLKELETENLVDLIKDIDSLFIEFEERSRLNFEKATFLIGKELGEVKDTLNAFVKDLKKLLEENKPFLDSMEVISLIDSTLKEVIENNKLLDEIDRKNKEELLKIDSFNAESISLELELEKLRSSENYRKEIESEALIKIKKEELEKQVYQLKDMIDFKKLANVFHYDSKKMNTINEYKLNFMNTFQRDKLLSLIPLLNDANIADSFINKKTSEIIQREKEIEKIRGNMNKKESDNIYDLNRKISKSKSEADIIRQEISKDEKRKEKINQKRTELLNEAKDLLKKIDVELELEQ